jgi:hypothetical protein
MCSTTVNWPEVLFQELQTEAIANQLYIGCIAIRLQ